MTTPIDTVQALIEALEHVATSETFYRDPRGDRAGPAIDAGRVLLAQMQAQEPGVSAEAMRERAAMYRADGQHVAAQACEICADQAAFVQAEAAQEPTVIYDRIYHPPVREQELGWHGAQFGFRRVSRRYEVVSYAKPDAENEPPSQCQSQLLDIQLCQPEQCLSR